MSAPEQKEGKPNKSSNRRFMTGVVVKKSGDKTVAVQVSSVEVHGTYYKRRIKVKKFMAHDEKNECVLGDMVKIVESRPLSARKRWVAVKIDNQVK